MTRISQRIIKTFVSAIALVSANAATFAADYPDRAIKLIVPWAAGGDTDLIFRPFALGVVAPFGSPAENAKALDLPKYMGGPLAEKPDYTAMLTKAHRRFPDAEFRILSLPRKDGDPISLRMKQPA